MSIARLRKVSPVYELLTINPGYPTVPSMALLFQAEAAGLQATVKAKHQLITDVKPFFAPVTALQLPSGLLVPEPFRHQKEYEEQIKNKGCRALPMRVLLEWLQDPKSFPVGCFLIASRPAQLLASKLQVEAPIKIEARDPNSIVVDTYNWLAVYDE